MFSEDIQDGIVLWTEAQLEKAIVSVDINSIQEGLITGAILPVVSAGNNYLFRWFVDNYMCSEEFRVLVSERYHDIMLMLLEIESVQVDTDSGYRLLSQVLSANQNDKTKALIDKLLSLENVVLRTSKKVLYLTKLAKYGYLENLKLLLLLPQMQNQLKRDIGDPHDVLMSAVRENHVHIVRYLLTFPMFVNVSGLYRNCALRVASKEGFLEIVAMLLEVKAVRDNADGIEVVQFLGNKALGAEGYNAWSGIFFLLMEQSNAAEGLRHLEHSTHYTEEKFVEKSQKVLEIAKMPLEMIGYPIFREKRLQTVDSRRYFIQHQLSDFWNRIYVFVCGCHRVNLSLPPELWGIIIEDYKYRQIKEPKAIPYLTSARKVYELLDQEQALQSSR